MFHQNLSLTTDSEADVEQHESMSQLDLSADLTGDMSGLGEHTAALALSSEDQSEGEMMGGEAPIGERSVSP